MMEDELYELLENYKIALQDTMERLDQATNRINDLEGQINQLNTTFYKDILEPAQAALDENMKADRYDDFSSKYGERLAPLAEQVNKIEGDDYDFMKEAFDNYDSMEADENGEKVSSDDYVETLVSETEKQIKAIKEALGAEDVEVKIDETGDVEVKADGEDVTEEVTDDNGEIKTEEEIKEDVTPESAPTEDEKVEIVDDVGEDESDPEELAELEKQLEEEAKRFK